MLMHSFDLSDDLYSDVLVMSEVAGINVSELVSQALFNYLYEREEHGTV
jgi:hypothetical protein